MTYIHAPVRVVLPDGNGVRVEIDKSERVVPIPSGAQGLPGEPGFSPIVTVDPITGGNRVTITDEEGDNTFDVMNGTQGEPGEGVPTGGVTGQVLKKRSNTDYDTYWGNEYAPVTSVNGQTGNVVLPIPTKTSDLTNDSGFVNATQAASAAPVQSVNGQTGAVTTPVTPLSDATPSPLGTASAGTSADASRADHVHAMPSASDVGALPSSYPTDWTLAGTSKSSSQTVTYPATAKELFIKGRITSGQIYSCIVPVAMLQDVTTIMVGGYAAGSSDIGIANVNHDAANRTLSFRNLRYGSSSTSGTFSFYYR